MIAFAIRAAAAAAMALATTVAAAAPQYAITDLGALPGGHDISFGQDINDHGWVTGIAYTDVGRRAFLWTPQSGMRDLGSLAGGGFESIGTGINNQGQVVGWSLVDASYQTQGYVWSASGGMQSLGDIKTNAINDAGTIAGSHVIEAGQAARPLPSGFSAYAINSHGQMAGIRTIGRSTGVFLLDGNQVTDLAALPAAVPWAYAHDINAHADVVGVSTISGGEHAVLWRDGAVVDLGDFAGGLNNSRALGINDDGLVVGYGTTGGGGLGLVQAALWDADGTLWNLNDLISPDSGWTLVNANAINRSGMIVGYGTNPLGQVHAFVLTAVPEPGTCILLLAGLAAMGMVGRSSRPAR